jgi:hypothetical protein
MDVETEDTFWFKSTLHQILCSNYYPINFLTWYIWPNASEKVDPPENM